VTTYRHTCRCGAKSPSFDSKRKSRDWLASHHRREGCVSRSTARALLDDVEFKARLASARRFKKIPLPSTPTATVEWHDSSFNAWGAPAQRQVVAKAWGGGNCLKGCIASILGAAIDRVPDPSDFSEDWLDRYSQRLAAQTGYRLDKIPAHACPPRSAHQLWIATIDERPDPSDHCVVAAGRRCPRSERHVPRQSADAPARRRATRRADQAPRACVQTAWPRLRRGMRQPNEKTGWLEPEERERPTTHLPGGFMLLAGRVDPPAIAGHALEETGANGIGCVFAEED
jgi:hypothetical protein